MKKQFYLSLLALALASCGTQREASSSTGWQPTHMADGSGKTGDESAQPFKRVVIYNASVDLAVKQPDSINNQLMRIAQRYQGYALQLGSGTSTIRVKSQALEQALTDLSALGRVRSKNISGNDITEEYQDVGIRLDNARRARDKYLDLLQKSANVDEALKVERELERLNREIDLLEGKQNRLQHLSEFSTITVHYSEKKKPGLLGYIGIGLYHSVKWLFVRN